MDSGKTRPPKGPSRIYLYLQRTYFHIVRGTDSVYRSSLDQIQRYVTLQSYQQLIKIDGSISKKIGISPLYYDKPKNLANMFYTVLLGNGKHWALPSKSLDQW